MIESISIFQWIILSITAICIGMSKTGVQGITLLIVPYMAIAFGAKESTGVILPMLCIADIMAVAYYKRIADCKVVAKLLPTAILGGSAEIPTIDGRVKIKIEPGTQPGKTVRLRGKGLPALHGYGYGYGDLIVNISVYIPETLTKEEHSAFEKMRGSESFIPSQSTKTSFFQKFKNLFS